VLEAHMYAHRFRQLEAVLARHMPRETMGRVPASS
jgi:hypothetical protein